MNPPVHHLEDLLDREIDAARKLSIALVAERAALVGDEPAKVHEMAAEKGRLLAMIEALEVERRALWSNPEAPAAVDAGGAGITATLAERWRALMNVIAGCRTANEINGHIIHIRQNQIRQLIDIVRGGAPVTYGPKGTPQSKAQRALARA